MGSLVVGDSEGVLAELELASARYLIAFLLRFSLVAPSLALRLAWRLARRRVSDTFR